MVLASLLSRFVVHQSPTERFRNGLAFVVRDLRRCAGGWGRTQEALFVYRRGHPE